MITYVRHPASRCSQCVFGLAGNFVPRRFDEFPASFQCSAVERILEGLAKVDREELVEDRVESGTQIIGDSRDVGEDCECDQEHRCHFSRVNGQKSLCMERCPADEKRNNHCN